MTNKDRKKIVEAYVRLHSDQNMTYTSENGYTGKIYGKSSFVILDKNGDCVMHTGFRSFHTFEELKEHVDTFPEFSKMLNGKRDCENCKHHTENGCESWECAFEPQEREDNVCKDCYYNDGDVHAECVMCDKVESEGEE